MHQTDNVDSAEIARFASMADLWWDRRGEFKALHDINPARLAFVCQHIGSPADKQVLDVGCGGGLLSEALAARGARVTGIDMAAPALAVAQAHMRQSGLDIAYIHTTAEALANQSPNSFDAVTCMELIEHVPRPADIVSACARLVKPGGDLFFASVNRTWLSGLLVIFAAEYLLGIVRRGTHHYRKLVRPAQLRQWAHQAGLTQQHISGLRYLPVGGYAALCRSTQMNYLMHFKRKDFANVAVG